MRTVFQRIRYALEYAWYGLIYCMAMRLPARAWCAIDENDKFVFRQPGLWIIQQAWVFAYLGTFDEWRRMTGRATEGER